MLAGRERNPILRMIHNWEARRLHAYEVECLRRFDSVWVTTQSEADRLQAFDQRKRLRVILRGIDLEHFSFGLDNAGSRSLIFTGHMSYEPNVDGILYYLRDIHERVRQLVPESRLQVVGNYPHRRILKAARGRPEVVVTGPVKDMAAYLRKAKVFIVPLRIGTGVRIKILEAMAVGLPVISTSIGCAGIGTVPEEHLLIADDPDEFARAVKRLFDDDDLYRRLSRNARKFVEEHYDLRLAAAEMESALREIRITKPE